MIHPESLLRLSLVRQTLEDYDTPLVPRAIDASWWYAREIPVSVCGFNPFSGLLPYPASSAFARWLREPASSARAHNEGDHLVYELLFIVHDHLHAWAVSQIGAAVPEQRFGRGRITPERLESLVFLYLLTEAVATCGLDYWFLSTFDINQVVPIGTNHVRLTVDYRESDLGEYKRFQSDFEVQDRSFFRSLAAFYCTGVWRGFDLDAIKQSPKLLLWLKHELSYGKTQRIYARQWLRHLATGEIQVGQPGDGAPVQISADWQSALISGLADLLWDKVKNDRPRAGHRITSDWASPPAVVPDLRFTRLVDEPPPPFHRGLASDDNRRFWSYQMLSRLDRTAASPELRKHLSAAARQGEVSRLVHLARDLPRISCPEEAPRDLLMLN